MADYSKLGFTSAFRYEHIATKGSISFSNSGYDTFTIPHNLGYKPYYKLFYRFGTGNIYVMSPGPSSYLIDGVSDTQVDNVYADNTNIYVIMLVNYGGPYTGTIYYRIYAEPQA